MFLIHRGACLISRAKALVLSATVIAGTHAAVIPTGPNYFETVPAGTFMDFSRENIPRGFLARVPMPSSALSACKRAPINPSTLGTTDTVVQRLGDINVRLNARPVSVPIGLIAASLVSVTPLTVTFNQGHNPELWDVRVSLQPNEQQPRGGG